MLDLRLVASDGTTELELLDVEVVRTYQLNHLGFWLVYRSATGDGGTGQFFVKTESRLEVIAPRILTPWPA